MAVDDHGKEEPDVVTFSDVARLIVDMGLAESYTRQGARDLADSDPNWPVPRDEWKKIGTAWVMPWPPIREYLLAKNFPGRGPDKQPRKRGATPGE